MYNRIAVFLNAFSRLNRKTFIVHNFDYQGESVVLDKPKARCKVPTRTGENEPDPYMDLQPRPEEGRTYQEMAITSTVSSNKPGESRLPSPNLFNENQNVAQ